MRKERSRTLRSDGLLLLTSAIWGLAFVAQRVGMEYIGPFLFNGVRFALGAGVLLPFIFLFQQSSTATTGWASLYRPLHLKAGILAGGALFLGASFQQVGIVYTTAGKAGFITGLYVILVPILGLFWGKRTYPEAWMGACLAVVGLYFLSVTEDWAISRGDLLVFVSAIFWAIHVHIIDHFTVRMPSLPLAHIQFLTCAVFSLMVAIWAEPIQGEALLLAWKPILYAGLLSTGVAYTLQVVAQKEAHPTHAAILLSLEAVFAVLGGWGLLAEVLNARQLLGCALMLAGMMVSQIRFVEWLRISSGRP
ncbi:MAG: DMT family transporter [Calditrichaeota bacterium]|nr:DMT family transporter [Calditrichota bacterium]